MKGLFQDKVGGIWKDSQHYAPVDKEFQLTLSEGNTPEAEFAGIIFKREDLNPTGSIKDRGMAYQISKAYQEGHQALVISSSGNAAISAASYCQLVGIKLKVFASLKINREKLFKIKELGAEVEISKKAVSEAERFSKGKNIMNLRPSVEKFGSEGYKSLAFELDRHLGKIDSLFVPVSSGTGFSGIGEGYRELGYLPMMFAVQTSAVCPIASQFDTDYVPSPTSLADALVARVTARREEVLTLIHDSGGGAFVVDDKLISKGWEQLEGFGITTSGEGAAALAGILKAKGMNKNLGEKVVCLLTGRKYSS
ncbi:MAG: pyridoxal-phosphate dependent enzyme [bacterium]|nr:pyridoxal-phosphate dependent enzyme [bacterium]